MRKKDVVRSKKGAIRRRDKEAHVKRQKQKTEETIALVRRLLALGPGSRERAFKVGKDLPIEKKRELGLVIGKDLPTEKRRGLGVMLTGASDPSSLSIVNQLVSLVLRR